ncbi:MAG: hypothetical protein JO057_15780 [Chloroflexi bacterium]|nr:hypothetical protein [Chloroflexota bacterium]
MIKALTTAADQRIDANLAAGRITADQAANRKSQVTHRVTRLVNHTSSSTTGQWRGGPHPHPTPAS